MNRKCIRFSDTGQLGASVGIELIKQSLPDFHSLAEVKRAASMAAGAASHRAAYYEGGQHSGNNYTSGNRGKLANTHTDTPGRPPKANCRKNV